MSIEDSRQGALVCKRCCGSPATSRTTGPKGGVCFASNTDLELWRHRQHDHLPEALSGGHPHRAKSQLQHAVKVSAKGKHVKCKMDLERCLFIGPGRQPRAAPRGVRAPPQPRACGGLRGPLPVLAFQQLGACGFSGRGCEGEPLAAGQL